MARVSTEDLSVEFAIFGAKSRSLKNRILSQATGGRIMSGARDIVSVRAIDGLNLEIHDGDRVGLVGHNGSGKSTLLRVLCGIYKPSRGALTVTGRARAILESHAGMDQEATGLENIYLRGYMLGMSTREIRSKVDDIVEFTELGDFIELPMRTYSAGMFTRLAFGVSTAADADVLLVDEGIGAGDAGFQAKVEQRIEKLFARTAVVVLASHSDTLIQRYCNRTIELSHGKLVRDEPTAKTPPPTRRPADGNS